MERKPLIYHAPPNKGRIYRKYYCCKAKNFCNDGCYQGKTKQVLSILDSNNVNPEYTTDSAAASLIKGFSEPKEL